MNKIKKEYTSGHKMTSDNIISDVSLCEHCQRLCIEIKVENMVFIDLPHGKGSFELLLNNKREKVIVTEFMKIIENYSLDIDKQDIKNILRLLNKKGDDSLC